MAGIFETHAHYDDARYDQDRDALLSNMRKKRVEKIVTVAASEPEFNAVLRLTEQYDFIYGAIGVHPDHVPEMTEETISRMRELAGREKVVAIGEIGYDLYGEATELSLQTEWFLRQMTLAEECDLPVIIHSRDAAERTYRLLSERKRREIPGVVHCFSYSAEMAERFRKLGYYIGVGGVVTFKNGRVLREAVEKLSLDDIVLETDSPYLSPTPFRGERNDSGNIRYIAEEIARIKGVTPEEVYEKTYRNACRLYRIS